MIQSRRNEEILVAADIGTSKVCVVIGRRWARGLDVIGFGSHASRGLQKGEVIETEATAECLRLAVEEAVLMAGTRVDAIHLGVSAGHIRGRRAHGMVNVMGDEVTAGDVERVLDAARKPGPEPGRILLHTLVKDYVLDHREGLRRPVGSVGHKLEVRAHLVTASERALQHLTRCATRCGLAVEGITLDSLASSYAVLREEEREEGVVLVDIGGSTTEVAIWVGGALVHTGVVKYGGDAVTKDVGIGLRTTRNDAERLKKRYGSALTDRVPSDETFVVPGTSGRPGGLKPRTLLATIIEPRMSEILRLVRREVELSGYQDAVHSGYVLTGGGAAIKNCQELGEQVMGARVRCGIPEGVGGLVDLVRHPKYASAVGLLKYAAVGCPDSFRVRQQGLMQRTWAGLSELFQRLL